MTIKKLMMAAGAIDGPQVIALSSNDWDTSLGIFNFSGNTLGDHTIGGNVHAYQAKENFSSLITLDGDFVISFTMEDSDEMTFGVYGIESDSDRTNTDHSGMYYMSAANTAFWWGSGYASGASARINGGAEGSFTAPANGSAMIIRRVSGTITLEDDGAVLHTYSVTYSNPMRFAGGSDTNGLDASLKDLFITDTDKIQRDGHIHEAINSGIGFGDAVSSSKHVGQLWTPTRSGDVTGFKIDIQTVSAALTCHVEIWSHDGTNPASQVGGDSDSLSLSVAILSGTFSGTLPTVKKGTRYWVIFVDEGTSGNAVIRQVATAYGTDTGRNDTLTSMTDGGLTAMKIEVQVDTSAGEPTPDHDTLLLIHSNTTDGSTTFADSSQFGRTVSVVGTAQHDTAQNILSQTSAMLFDGNSDFLTVPDSDDWAFNRDFTVECRFRLAATTSNMGLISQDTSGAWSGVAFSMRVSSGGPITVDFSNNAGAGITLTGGTDISADTWYHAALVRVGTRFNVYLDGTSDATATSSLTIYNIATPINIGKVDDPAVNQYLDGWISEVRISNVARWDANFTPPSAPYP